MEYDNIKMLKLFQKLFKFTSKYAQSFAKNALMSTHLICLLTFNIRPVLFKVVLSKFVVVENFIVQSVQF